mmetsp:Transcript_121548/g.355213  ORF Transcript_121548/g.355213 Transcript_121548/m.355213 type:complete len:406 (+) Transcript_121548:96-1313(+)
MAALQDRYPPILTSLSRWPLPRIDRTLLSCNLHSAARRHPCSERIKQPPSLEAQPWHSQAAWKAPIPMAKRNALLRPLALLALALGLAFAGRGAALRQLLHHLQLLLQVLELGLQRLHVRHLLGGRRRRRLLDLHVVVPLHHHRVGPVDPQEVPLDEQRLLAVRALDLLEVDGGPGGLPDALEVLVVLAYQPGHLLRGHLAGDAVLQVQRPAGELLHGGAQGLQRALVDVRQITIGSLAADGLRPALLPCLVPVPLLGAVAVPLLLLPVPLVSVSERGSALAAALALALALRLPTLGAILVREAPHGRPLRKVLVVCLCLDALVYPCERRSQAVWGCDNPHHLMPVAAVLLDEDPRVVLIADGLDVRALRPNHRPRHPSRDESSEHVLSALLPREVALTHGVGAA